MIRRFPATLRLTVATLLAMLVLRVTGTCSLASGLDEGQPAVAAAPPAAAAAPAAAGPASGGDDQAAPEWAVKRAAELGGGVKPEDVMGAHPIPADVANPDRRTLRPALGGRVIMHLPSQPANLCYTIENSSATTFMLYELHAALLRFNWETWKQDLELARSMDVEDTLILKGGRTKDNGNVVFGKVTEEGDDYLVTSGSPYHPMEPTRVPKSEVESLEPATVITFRVRDDVKWHDGHPFDAADVLFSRDLYDNPTVDCDQIRYRFTDIVKDELLDKYTVRFFWAHRYFQTIETFNDTLCILPSHLYNLKDPDNKDYDPDASPEKQGQYINENPHNIQWVGLGPYKLKEWARDQYVEAERFPDYFEKDPAKCGYVDTIRWRFIEDDNTAFQALLNGELDIFWRVKAEDYYGQQTEQPAFTDSFYKAFTYAGAYNYTAWNLYRKKFEDVRVRTALAAAFDNKSWIDFKYKGLAVPVTGPFFFLFPANNPDVKAIPFDLDHAEELLAEAGWYDRDVDGIVDKDGENLEIEWLMPSGNKASEAYGLKMQESFAKIGVKLKIQALEWATFLERMKDRDFDAVNLAWTIPELESDPYQIWHSSQAAPELRSSNNSGFRDAQADSLIERGRAEPDFDKRQEIWRQLHARIYELQPYLFGQTPPLKIAFNKRLRGVKLYHFYPGFKLRDMYYPEGTPGTRPLSGS